MNRGGRGRGRGSARGNFGTGSSLMGGFTYQDLKDFSSKQSELYPPFKLPDTEEPDKFEALCYKLGMDYEDHAANWIYRLDDDKSADPAHQNEILKAKIKALTSDDVTKRWQEPGFFPRNIWEPLVEKKQEERRQKSKRKRDTKNFESKAQEEEEGAEGLEAEIEDEIEEKQSEESSEEEDQDYDNNYFDNGEDDDEGGSGGDDDGVMD